MIVWAAVPSSESISGCVGCKSGLTKVVASDWNPVRSLIHVLLQGTGNTLSESALCAHSCWGVSELDRLSSCKNPECP